MNNQRRKQLARLKDSLQQVGNDIEELRSAEEDSMDNIPDNLRYGDRYDTMESCVEALADAIESIENAIERISDIA